MNPMVRNIFPLLLGLCVCLQFSSAREPDKIQAEADAYFRTGEWEKARDRYQQILDLGDIRNGINYFETFMRVGDYRTAGEKIKTYLKQFPDDPYLLNIEANLQLTKGDYQTAESVYERVKNSSPVFRKNKFDLAQLLLLTGRKPAANEIFREIYQEFLRGTIIEIDALILSARAAEKIGEFHAANRIYQQISRISPGNPQILFHWGKLFTEKYNNAEAQQMFEEALEINPHWADLYVAYANSIESFVAKEELAQKALAENPNHVGAMNILAGLHILDSRYQEAEDLLHQAENINPSDPSTLANLASVYHLREQSDPFKTIEERALKINPKAGNFYDILAENCSIRFRYQDAVDFGFRAVAVEPDNWNANALLGANLLRIGRADEARNYLNRGYENDKFNLFARNSLELIDEYENFDLLQSDHFLLKIHKSESGVLGRDILDLAEEAYDSLTNRYPYRPREKILLEAYNDHSDFGVRISGLPNLDLLGVCFGDIVAFDTPKARAQESYNWARTLWHELAHVMTIGLSDHRVPRWLTEGLSVYEEKRARPEWARRMEIELFTALDSDRLLPIDKINSGFTRPQFPGQIILSYYQSMKIVDYLIDRYGFSVIPSLLQGFRQKKSLSANFQDVLRRTPEQLSAEFFKQLQAERKSFEAVLLKDQNLFDSGKEEKFSLKNLFGEKNSLYFSTLFSGIQLAKEKNYAEAEKKLTEAINIYPYYTGMNNPYQVLIDIYKRTGDETNRIKTVEKFVAVSEYGSTYFVELADYYLKSENLEKAVEFLKRYFYENPYDVTAHEKLADICQKLQDFPGEIEQRRIVLALNPVDRVSAQYKLAFSLYNGNRKNEAKREVLKALDLAPGFRDAQKLLLLCVKGGR